MKIPIINQWKQQTVISYAYSLFRMRALMRKKQSCIERNRLRIITKCYTVGTSYRPIHAGIIRKSWQNNDSNKIFVPCDDTKHEIEKCFTCVKWERGRETREWKRGRNRTRFPRVYRLPDLSKFMPATQAYHNRLAEEKKRMEL